MSNWQLFNADCLGPEGLRTLPDKSVDHVICDPPYEAEAHTMQRRTKEFFEQGRGIEGAHLATKPVGFAPITEDMREGFAAQAGRLARRWVIVFCQAESVGLWRETMATVGGLGWRRSCVWIKPDGQPQLTGDRPGMGYESIACAHAPGRSRWNGGGRHGVYVIPHRSDLYAERTGHPTQKPGALMAALVEDFTDPGELILDPFAGSGTTGVAAIRLGRRFIGWERDPKYHAAAVRRLQGTREQLVLPGPRTKPKQGRLIP